MEGHPNQIFTPRFLYTCAAVCLLFSVVMIIDSYRGLTQEEPIPSIKFEQDNKYIGLIRLGLSPSANERTKTIRDIDTGIKLRVGDTIYALMESRTWDTYDYGKTFLTKIS